MSRIGKRPVVIPKGVTAKMEGINLVVKGPKGELKLPIADGRYDLTDVKVSAENVTVTRRSTERNSSMQQGLIRALVSNMVQGVAHGYTKTLDIVGVGYKAELKGKVLQLNLGYSHPVDFDVPATIQVTVDKGARVTITGVDKQLVGEMAASIRRIRPPEPYKGKGVRYSDEIVKKKVGKAAATTGAGGG